MSTALSTVQEYSDPTVVANLMNEQRFGRMMVIAETMASASLIPDHLLGKKKGQNFEYFTADEIRANCFLIVNQSFRWGMDPFAVMPETYVVGGKLAYQGKLIAGLVNSLANLEERLSYAFTGTKGSDDFTVTVSGKFRGAAAPVTVQVSIGQAKTENQMWRKDPEQKLVYTGATKWARRWCPEIILGILTDDDAEQIEMRDVTPRDSANVKVITGGTAATEPDKKAPRAKATPKTSEETVATGTATGVATGVADLPTRDEISAIIRKRMKELKIGLPVAETRCREAGLLKAGQTFTGASDEELHIISRRLEVLDAPEAVTEPTSSIRACYENHQVSHSAPEAERKWTCWRLRYSVSGDETIRETVTFSSTIGDILDTLEGGEGLILTLKSGTKGDTIETLELVQEGGAA